VNAAHGPVAGGQPVVLRYFAWLFRVLRGDLGWSPSNSEPVPQAIAERLPVLVLMMALQLTATFLLRMSPAGIVSADALDLGDRLAHLSIAVLAVPFGACTSLISYDFFRARNSLRIRRGIVGR
jgi:peptide/nickel transport system permease protein